MRTRLPVEGAAAAEEAAAGHVEVVEAAPVQEVAAGRGQPQVRR